MIDGRERPLRIAVAGAGYAGLSVAMHLHRYAEEPVEVELFEATAGIGRGPAYTWRNPVHLLNGEAAHLSIFDEERDDFVEWLLATPEAAAFLRDDLPVGNQFVPRFLFADYVRARFAAALRAEGPVSLRVRTDTAVVDAEPREGGVGVRLSTGERMEADLLVLATGNPAPRPFFTDLPGVARVEDPWQPEWPRSIPPGPVLIAGTGQTMIDAAVALRAVGHRGIVHAVSRRGVVPQTHRYFVPPRAVGGPLPPTLRQAVRFVRREVEAAVRDGADWRAVTNAIRPLTLELWTSLSTAEQRRYFRHLAQHWWGYRQRVAPQVGAALDAMRDDGSLVVHRASIERIEPCDAGARATLSSGPMLECRTLVNCTGPDLDCRRGTNPVVRSLVARGLARPHATGAGLDVTADLALVAADGTPSPMLFTLGAQTRGAYLETFAIRDIRRQSRGLAKTLLGTAVAAPLA